MKKCISRVKIRAAWRWYTCARTPCRVGGPIEMWWTGNVSDGGRGSEHRCAAAESRRAERESDAMTTLTHIARGPFAATARTRKRAFLPTTPSPQPPPPPRGRSTPPPTIAYRPYRLFFTHQSRRTLRYSSDFFSFFFFVNSRFVIFALPLY